MLSPSTKSRLLSVNFSELDADNGETDTNAKFAKS